MCITESLCYIAEIGIYCKSTIFQFFKKSLKFWRMLGNRLIKFWVFCIPFQEVPAFPSLILIHPYAESAGLKFLDRAHFVGRFQHYLCP